MNRPPAIATLIDILCDDGPPPLLSPGTWSEIVAAARATNLLGTLGERMAASATRTGCNADRHLDGARQLSERQRRSVCWEAHCIDRALARLGIPVVLLKGTAYVLGGHPNAIGRLFGDVDILVPAESLGAVEIALMVAGWTPLNSKSEYDQRYYRTWMHELPPMIHPRRGSIIDVHHTILPPTARLKPSPQRIIERSAPVPGFASLRVPCPEDLIVHSVTHLVHEGELGNGLRDLHDIRSLLVSGSGTPGFWDRLTEIAREHGLEAPVALGLGLVRRHMRVPLPADLPSRLPLGDGAPLQRTLMSLYDHALSPPAFRNHARIGKLADLALYVRAHWLRMPPRLLALHLARKAFYRSVPRQAEDLPRPQLK